MKMQRVFTLIAFLVIMFTVAGTVSADLVGHWKLDEGSNTTAFDSSGNNNHGTLTNDPIWTTGNVGLALKFDGMDDYVETGADTAFSVTSMTLAAWVNMPGSVPVGWRTILEHNRFGANWYGLWKSAAGSFFHFRWDNDGGGSFSTNFNTTVAADTWYHVVGTYDASTNTARTYLNGVLDNTVTGGTTGTATTDDVRIGRNNANREAFDGLIDDLRIYDRALTADEIQELHQENMAVNFSAFNITKAKVHFRCEPNYDKFKIKGEFVLGDSSNGIDPVNEDVIVTLGTSSIVIPSPFSFVEETTGIFKFEGTVNGADVKMKIKETDFNTFNFKIKAKGVDLTGTCNPVDIELIVGDDKRQTNSRLCGLLKNRGSDDGSSDDDSGSDDDSSDD